MYHDIEIKDWRDDRSITKKIIYSKRFSWFPTKIEDGKTIFWKKYYTGLVYLYYDKVLFSIEKNKVGNISEREYLFRKLSGKLESVDAED